MRASNSHVGQDDRRVQCTSRCLVFFGVWSVPESMDARQVCPRRVPRGRRRRTWSVTATNTLCRAQNNRRCEVLKYYRNTIIARCRHMELSPRWWSHFAVSIIRPPHRAMKTRVQQRLAVAPSLDLGEQDERARCDVAGCGES